VLVTGGQGVFSQGLASAEIYDPTAALLNISARLRVLTGDNVLIGGFIITGIAPKRVIIRGLGPSLPLGGELDDPILELHKPDGSVITNDNWKATQRAEIEGTGLPPANDLESAIVTTLAPGAYTAILRGTGGTTGLGLVEIYDLAQNVNSKLANISSRSFVDTGDNAMIGGFTVGPASAFNVRVLVRAMGPSLPLGSTLQDPTLELHNGSGTLLAFNNDWKDTQQAQIEATGLQPSDNRESAILAAFAPGTYTAIVRGRNNTAGVGLVEVYNLP
jgi:hypothetical protein